MMRAEFERVFEGADEGGVFGLVVGHLAEAAGLLDGVGAVGFDNVGERRRAGVATRGAVGVNMESRCLAHRFPFPWTLRACRIVQVRRREKQPPQATI